MRKVPAAKVVTALEASESPLPPQIQEALGELVGAAREGLLALSVGVGLGVVHELMELEVDEVVGPKGKHDPDRVAKRHGHEDGSMTLGGRRVAVRRPRMRTADDERELPVATYGYFADRDPLTRAVMDRMLAGVSTRKFARVGEPVGAEVEQASSSTAKTTVSEHVHRAHPHRAGRADVAPAGRRAPGGDDARRPGDRRSHATSSRSGSAPRASRSRSGSGKARPRTPRWPARCWPISSTAAWIPSRRSCSSSTAARRCGGRSRTSSASTRWCIAAIATRRRNVSDLLPERDRDQVRARMRAAWSLTDAELARQRLELLAGRARPDVARRRRLAPRRHARHADADAARDHRPARQDAVLDEPVRVDDRDRPLHPAQRQALAATATCASAGPPPACSSPSSSSDGSSATATSPSSSSPSNATPLLAAPNDPDRHEVAEPVTV